jgi:hypothetical protein
MKSWFPARRSVLATGAAKWANDIGLTPGSVPPACPLAAASDAEAYAWFRGDKLECVTIPVTELDLLPGRHDRLWHAADWATVSGVTLVAAVPAEVAAPAAALVRIRSNALQRALQVSIQSIRIKPPPLNALVHLLAQATPGAVDDAVIFGSAAMQLRGLARLASDLDVFVSEETFAAWSKTAVFVRDCNVAGIERLRLEACPLIEVYKEYPGVTFDEVHNRAVVLPESEGFPVGAVDSVLQWKLAQARERCRDKDLADIKLLEATLASRGGQTEQ